MKGVKMEPRGTITPEVYDGMKVPSAARRRFDHDKHIISLLNDALIDIENVDSATKRVGIEIRELFDAEEHIKSILNEIKMKQGDLNP